MKRHKNLFYVCLKKKMIIASRIK